MKSSTPGTPFRTIQWAMSLTLASPTPTIGVSEPYFQEACKWVKDTNPALVFLQGHWNSQDMGCKAGMDTEDVFTKVQSISGCDTLGTRLKYVEGHDHCNKI